MKKIIVVGGGAGGLEIVKRLSQKLGRKNKAEIILVDKSQNHVWKPLLHEVAAGVIDKNSDGINYRIHAVANKYQFQLGNMCHIDNQNKQIELAPLFDENDQLILPKRTLKYDTLVLAIGSVCNDFGTPGVADHCYFLDSLAQAESFHKALLNQLLRINQKGVDSKPLHVAIVGGGATGTELAAQLHHVANLARAYGMPEMSADKLTVTIIEAGERILPALPEKITNSARQALTKLGIKVLEGTKVTAAKKEGFVTSDDELIEADLMVWSAGVKAPDFITQLGIFETNRANQILVTPYLKSTIDENVYAIGDCCGFQQEDGRWVPPRAQSAHQMASTAATNIINEFNHKPGQKYVYKDYGSLVHLSKYSTVGNLMGALSNSSMFIEGRLAKLVYISLYNMHLFAIHGWFKGIFILFFRKVRNIVGPKLKLH
ncbi:NAD(P)/FAD-dependent oxidoreductase [Aliiglaciecola sp. 3_MG-2023]|uniref:NAD(P)/FAD-dependent oxidoreductase n=1 Tax=Aliiglaciecola sp. 3_MG-2023 TaxID=3062644 RepID=UPI0026E3D214|nr:NAD(P)/FAD-dependent oxidoreductase [Aliiglaciecola sp. 3_MG-2023]MDO6694599.1 NAD(P)/FAD-dependent oxidoreductase [Aliiglaciecola sp. 3_MG-2023]